MGADRRLRSTRPEGGGGGKGGGALVWQGLDMRQGGAGDQEAGEGREQDRARCGVRVEQGAGAGGKSKY